LLFRTSVFGKVRIEKHSRGTDVGALMREFWSVSLYKSSQGRVARRATFAALAVIVLLGAWSMHSYYKGVYFGSKTTTDTSTAAGTGELTLSQQQESKNPATSTTAQKLWTIVIPLALCVAGIWASFRAVQLPSFADFLISVEGEMNKVSWPARGELFRASVVVIFVIFFLAAILLIYDTLLTFLMMFISWGLDWITDKFSGWFG
jgi:preprotein translocase subunit SecE